MSQNLLFSLLAPSRKMEHAMQLALILLVSAAMVVGIDFIGDGRLHGGALIYAAQMLVVVVPFTLMLRAISDPLRRLQHRLDGVQNRDPLTATYNRHAFTRYATRALPQSGALLMLDVDQLKMINQRLGHDAGDLCLMALAMKFRESTRATDITGRLDGATFAIYMPGAPMDIAATIAERLRDGIQVTTADGLLHVTVSVGAVAADGMTPLKVLMRDASVALARAKLAGRGGLILHELPAVA